MLEVEPVGPGVGGVLVVHSWWGLTESFRQYASALAEDGFHVVVPDLYHGRTARTQAEAERLRARRGGISRYRLLEAGLDTLRTRHAELPVAVVGFSVGGHWAVWLAQRPQYRIRAAILYYAARAGTFTPGTSFLAHVAEADPWVTPGARVRMESAIRRAGCDYTAYDYPGCAHWFAESDREEYDADAAALARSRDIAHLTSAVGGSTGSG